MIVKLNEELAAALRDADLEELEVVDPHTARTYVLVDSETHRQAMEALRKQQDRIAIAQGIAEMEAGEGIPLDTARRLIRENLLRRNL